jgi:hypothetical protein
MRPVVYSLAALLTSALFLISLRGVRADVGARSQAETTVRPPELEYFKAINQAAPPKDPQLLFLLMAQYSNLNLQGEGAEFFAARFKEFEPRLTDPQKSLYLSATALLRAQHASSVPLLHRIGYVNDTIAMLDRAGRLSGGRRPDRNFGLAPGAHIGAHPPQADEEQYEREQRRQRIGNRSHSVESPLPE